MSGAVGRFGRAFPTLLRVGLASAVAYRAEFLVWMLATTMPLVMLAVMSAMARDGNVGRFDQKGFVAYYLVTLIVRQMTGAWVTWEMTQEIKDGTLGLRLLRPIHPLIAYSAESLAAVPLRGLVALPIAAVLLVMTSSQNLTRDPVNVAVFFASLAGAWLLNFAVAAIIGTLALFIQSSLQVWELWFGCFMLFSGYLIPLELLPHWLAPIARVSPFAYLLSVPVETLTGMRDRAEALAGLCGQLGWAAIAWGALLILWNRGLKRFAAFGG
jgi:ABC-2 type transport system permease protein